MDDRREGIYRIIEDGEDGGTERWRFTATGGVITFTSVIDRTLPSRRQEQLTVRLSPDWRPRSLMASVATPAGERRYHGRRAGDEWVSQVVDETAGVQTITFPFDDSTHVDYYTPHTNTITIRRLGLEPGEAREIDVVYIEPDRLIPSLVRQRYERLGSDAARESGDARVTQRFRYTSLDSGWEGTIWSDVDGFVIRYDGLFDLLPATS